MASDNETIGALVTEYTEVRKHRACLQTNIDNTAKKCRTLSDALQTEPQRLTFSEESLALGNLTIPLSLVSDLFSILADYRDTRNELRRIEDRLKELGLGDLVRT